MATKKEIRLYAEDKFFEVFGQVDDFETEWSMLSEELSDFRTNSDVDECLKRLLKVYKEHMEDWSPVPKAME